MNKKIFYAAAAVMIAGTVLFISAGMSRRPPSGQSERETGAETETAYNFTLSELDGERVFSLSDFAGKPVFIDFWASWCPPCRTSAPYVERLAEEFDGRAYVIGINLDARLSDALGFLEGKESGMLHLAGYGTEVPDRYGVRGIPSFYIVDSNGNLASSHSGFSPHLYSSWVDTLNQLSSE